MTDRPADSRERVWNRLCSATGLIEQIDVASSPVLAPGSATFGPLTALAGVHGSGKSYMLSTLAAALPGWQTRTNLPIETDGHIAELRGEYRLRLRQGTVPEEIESSPPIDWRARAEVDAALKPLMRTMLTPYRALSELAFASQEHSPQRQEDPVDLVALTRRELDAIHEITGYDYQSLQYGWIEIGDASLPFVEGTRDSRDVNIWSMSSAEFWVHFVLHHLRTADENEVVLIDEPETFLAQPGHRSFIDEIARLTLASKCQTVIATHSESMLRRIPARLVRLVSSSPGGAVVSEVASTGALLRTLGGRVVPIRAVVFVEDDMAVQIVQAILRQYAPEQLEEFDVIDSGGKNKVVQGTEVAGRSRQLGVAGVLDGDQREEYDDADFFLLPGSIAPEAALLDALRSHEQEAAVALRSTTPDLRLALDAARFVSHQQLIRSISQSLGTCTEAEVRDVGLRLWLSEPEAAESARELAESLLAIASSSRRGRHS
jgi:ABC-type cobalamin/Fe3+-siderophores transport system ATPase subunit